MARKIVVTEGFLSGLEVSSPDEATQALIREIRSLWKKDDSLSKHVEERTEEIRDIKREYEKLLKDKDGKTFFHKVADALMESYSCTKLGPHAFSLILLLAKKITDEGKTTVHVWNSVLLEELSIGSKDTLAKHRRRCVEEGWIDYEGDNKTHPGIYRVNLPKKEYKEYNY